MQQVVDGHKTEDQPIWPFARGHPLSLQRTERAYLYIKGGNKVLDAGGAIVANIGHSYGDVAEAIHVNAVNPGLIESEIWEGKIPHDTARNIPSLRTCSSV